MEAAKHLLAHPEIEHGPIRVCFTCDEEVGRGVDHVDIKKLGAEVGYTLDGMGQGEIEGETFSADKATVTITGVNIHPSMAKGKMVNAIRLAGMFLDRLPRAALAPEVTEGREGFIHPVSNRGRRAADDRCISCSAISTRRSWPSRPNCCARSPGNWRPNSPPRKSTSR